MAKRVVVVGGVAGGMSCAARLKRLDDSIEVTVFEKGPDVSYANCGMPYFIGGVIEDRRKMNVQTAEGSRRRYGVDVRTQHEVTRIHRADKTVEVRNLATGDVFTQTYDTLVLAPGAPAIRPGIPGAFASRVFVLRDLQDMDAITAAIPGARHAAVVGAGFIGLELVENFVHRGLKVSLIELTSHVMPRMDAEMAAPLQEQLVSQGVQLYLGQTAEAIEANGNVKLGGGTMIESDFVCLCVGVRPASELARDAGLDLGERGFIAVDEHLRTSDPDIYAVGDAVQVKHLVTGKTTAIPLAGPANRQGRIAADNIAGRDSVYRGSLGSSIVKVFDLAVAQTGLGEIQAKQEGIDYHVIFAHPTQHAGYYPGATPITIKLLFGADGRILGAQAVAKEGADVIINVIATAIQGGMSVEDLEHLDLVYSPQWGSAKHAVNMLGFIAHNLLRGDMLSFTPDETPAGVLWLDVRNPNETAGGVIEDALVIPLDDLRQRFEEIPRDRKIAVYCAAGLRGYVACRFLQQQGFDVINLTGGYRTWCQYQQAKKST
ncbi:MAG: FAD-dependent oxidoreductase [Candidatus Hydrogenedentes bacterium]|nr:FAD-dependent oxidoreductase [Candidatus Hydrogenedentota bacterium]